MAEGSFSDLVAALVVTVRTELAVWPSVTVAGVSEHAPSMRGSTLQVNITVEVNPPMEASFKVYVAD
jgi:hypothetical protein